MIKYLGSKHGSNGQLQGHRSRGRIADIRAKLVKCLGVNGFNLTRVCGHFCSSLIWPEAVNDIGGLTRVIAGG